VPVGTGLPGLLVKIVKQEDLARKEPEEKEKKEKIKHKKK
jgi:hypothetical protein